MDLGRLMAQKRDNQPSNGVGWWGGGRWHNGRGCGVDRAPKEEAAEEVSGCGSVPGTHRSRSGLIIGPEMRQSAGRRRRMVGRWPLSE